MKLLSKYIDKKNAGSVTLVAEEAEDMWHAYNLINIDDQLRSSSIRRIINESSAGLTSTSRVHFTLTIAVKSLDFDTQASVLRVKGTNTEENQYIKMGAYHTIDLELNRKFTIIKNEWDSVSIERIDEACDPSKSADLAAVVMQEGLANICLITSSMTLVKAKIEMNIPRKRKGFCANHDKNMEKFYDRIIQALLTHINFEVVRAIIIASPGFLKDQFLEYMNSFALKTTNKILLDNKVKFLLVHSASGFKHSLKEIFEDANLANRLSDTKALGEVKALDSFYQMLKSEPSRAFYGYKHVEKANEADAIDVLLISDSLFRSKELSERKKYVQIVDKVKENNGQVRIFSSLHVSGEQLMQLTGIAAILRFPMTELEDDELSDSDSESEASDKQEESKVQEASSIVSLLEEPEVVVTKPTPAPIPKPNPPAKTTQHPKAKAKKATNNYRNGHDDDYDDYDPYDDY
ncbi:unnamed protein product [Brachionus calyciflorus]|uniref:eRF1/Pelota-like N-terminal domain-containing protein n=1 Tax=Brachionus calyciflorus TaxID=104777 RepID=A0A813MBK4_9BILA|nr:unnamed protein product [Brachionus calyciflorus]